MARIHFDGGSSRGGGAPLRRVRIDPATVVGFVSGFGLLIIAMSAGGSLAAYFDLPALLIVIGGTFGVTTICFSIEDMARAQKVAAKAIVHSRPDLQAAATRMLELAEQSRGEGILSLERSLSSLDSEPFARKALAMAIDSAPATEIEAVLGRDIAETQHRHATSAGIFRKAAEVSPAMGLIGTLIGLVQMLARLEDPASIGPAMAIALLTTFYGAVLSSMLFTPLAAKLERNSADEVLAANIYMLAAVSIARKDNPRKLEVILNSLLPPAKRLNYFD